MKVSSCNVRHLRGNWSKIPLGRISAKFERGLSSFVEQYRETSQTEIRKAISFLFGNKETSMQRRLAYLQENSGPGTLVTYSSYKVSN